MKRCFGLSCWKSPASCHRRTLKPSKPKPTSCSASCPHPSIPPNADDDFNSCHSWQSCHSTTEPMPSYQYPRAALTVDCVVFGFDEGELKVLLIERALEPFEGKWALPGGFVRVDETLDHAARRELAEEAGLKSVFLEQLYTFGAVDRDPRE